MKYPIGLYVAQVVVLLIGTILAVPVLIMFVINQLKRPDLWFKQYKERPCMCQLAFGR